MAVAQTNKTHCPQGHEYSLGNTYVQTSGARQCRICIRIHRREYRLLHPEKRVEQTRRWKKRYPEKNREQRANFRKNNPEKVKAYRDSHQEQIREQSRQYYRNHPETGAAWRLAHPDKVLSYARTHDYKRRQQLKLVVCDFTADQWDEIVTVYQGCCAYCGQSDSPLTQDHVIPVSEGGEHTAANIVPACRPCNSSKGAKLNWE